MFNGTSFGFVNCHLTSGNEKIARYLPQSYTHTRSFTFCGKFMMTFFYRTSGNITDAHIALSPLITCVTCDLWLLQEEPELPWYPTPAVTRRQTAELLRHLAALHAPLLARRSQLQAGYGHTGEAITHTHTHTHTHKEMHRVMKHSRFGWHLILCSCLLCVRVQEILNYINRKEFDPLLKVDQLNLEREKNKVFLRFGQ